jgi:ATP-dependent RNA helicase RhlE
MKFTDLNLIEPLINALKTKGYDVPTPIQQKAIPVVLQTAAFALPILQLLNAKKGTENRKGIKALVLAPTRELALQISQNFGEYGTNLGISHAIIYGGVSQFHQVAALKKGVDILIATPGRLLDLMQQGYVHLNTIEYLVLDEADRMLDMGFINDIKRVIAKIPAKRHTMFFSATASPDIMKLANTILNNPVSINVSPVSTAAETVKQSVYYVKREDKRLLLKHILKSQDIAHALVFTRTKRGADKVVKELNNSGVKAEAIHGNKSQNARERALNGFKDRTIRILVATDIASRGIDVDKLTHVINFELPEVAETYVHRIGRTGRAGESGIALSFCDHEEMPYLRDINKLIKKNIEVVSQHPYA